MNWLTDLIDAQWTEDIVWTFIHSIWQGVIIALLLKSYLNKAKSKPNKRYAASLLAMSSMLVCLLVTSAVINYSESAAAMRAALSDLKASETHTRPANTETNIALSANSAHAKPSQIKTGDTYTTANKVFNPSRIDWMGALFICWSAGVIIMVARIVMLLTGTNRLRRSCRPLTEGAEYEMFCELKHQMSITQKVILAISDTISVPGIIGMAKPIILLPASMATGLSPEDIRAILSHELAHIRRYDWLVNIFQLILEAVLFFNPAVWWISSQIRLEREAACDNASVAVTGEKHRYAQLLYEWGTSSRVKTSPALASITGFAGAGKSSPIADRIKRLVMPGYKPIIRFSILSVLGTLLISIILAVGLWKGTDKTVKYFGELLTPSQRIEKMDQLRKNYTPTEGEEERVKISGKVSTFDGREIGNWELEFHSYSRNIGIGSNSNARNKKNDRFNSNVPFGQSLLAGFMEGYAPYVKELDLKEGQELTDLQIVFDHGFEAKVKLVDEQGRPVENASVKTGLKLMNLTRGKGLEGVSGPDGIAILDNAIEHPMSIAIEADGFQKIEMRSFAPKKDHIHKFVMKKSSPAGGVVVSAETGLPLPEAEIRIRTKNTGGHMSGYGHPGKVIAKTDADGKFVLDTLEDEATYAIGVSCPGYGYGLLVAVRSGQKDIKVALGRPVTIKGKVIGNLKKLGITKKQIDGKWGRYPVIRASGESSIMRSGNSHQEAIVNEIDGAGYFELENVFGDQITLSSGKLYNLFKVQITGGKYEYNVLIDLDANSDDLKRDVTIKFIPPKDMPNPNGRVVVSWITESPRSHHNKTVDIKDGIGKLKIDTPCELLCRVYRWDNIKMGGYWFDRIKEVEVDDSKEEFLLEIPLKQAGSIFGKIVNPDGSAGYGYHTMIHIVKKPKGIADTGIITESINNSNSVSTGKYLASPIPFGGKYTITAQKGNYFLPGKPIKITSSKPIAEYNLIRGRSIDIKGKILFADGSPAANTKYSMYAEANIEGEEYPWGGTLKTTDENAQFIIEDINPDIETDYYLRIPSQNDRVKIKSITGYNTLKLHPTKLVSGLVLNEDTDEGIGGIPVDISVALGPKAYFRGGQIMTDKNGIFKITVPENAEVDADVQSRSIMGRYYEPRRRGGHLTFVLRPVNQLTGKLIDADTEEPIPAVTINGYGFGPSQKSYRSEYCPKTNTDGEFVINDLYLENYGVIDIKGYEIVGEKEISFSKGERKKHFTIKAKKL